MRLIILYIVNEGEIPLSVSLHFVMHAHTRTHTHSERRFTVPEEKTTSMSVFLTSHLQ